MEHFQEVSQVRFLAHLVMSLCNHALSIMCHCCCHHQCHWQHQHHWHLCTAIPVTALIIETSYLTDIFIYAPSLYTWNFKSMWCVFLNGSHFTNFFYVALLSTWLNLEPSILVQLCINTRAIYREEIMHLSIIFLKLWFFKKNHILHFLAHLTFMPKILSLYMAHHTHTDTCIQRHTQTYRYHFYILHLLAHLAYMPKIQI